MSWLTNKKIIVPGGAGFLGKYVVVSLRKEDIK